MGYYVHLHVAFSCDDNEPVAELAKKHLPLMTEQADGAREARWFLEDLSKRTGGNKGPKGGLSLWGITGNYTRGEAFVEALRPFFTEMFATQTEIFDHEHILVFEEPEQSEQCIAHEISFESGVMKVKRHECPFAFMQF
jgi:hypothetical protein